MSSEYKLLPSLSPLDPCYSVKDKNRGSKGVGGVILVVRAKCERPSITPSVMFVLLSIFLVAAGKLPRGSSGSIVFAGTFLNFALGTSNPDAYD